MRTLALVLVAILAGCGGGGSGPTVAPQAACVPQFVTVALYGDSTMRGYDGAGLVLKTPDVLLQEALDARFGRGNTLVVNHAIGSTTAIWWVLAKSVNLELAQVIVFNAGINDATAGESIADYKAALRALVVPGIIFETPNKVSGYDTGPYAQAMREVAAESGAPVADTYTYSTLGLLQDWAHPTQVGYERIVRDSLAPVVAAKVAPLLCQ